MSGRDVHDRLNDHFSTDLDTNAVLNGAVGSIASGSTVHAALLALVGGTALLVKEIDGSPSATPVKIIRVSNGTLTDDGGGQVTITTGGGGGGGSITVELLNGTGGVGSVTILRVGAFTNNTGGDVSLLPQVAGAGSGSVFFDSVNSNFSSPDTNGEVQVTNCTTTGDLNFEGVNFKVGPDGIGLYISEKDATTLQAYPWDNFDVELKDGGSNHHWKMATNDGGGGVAVPSLGMLPQYSAAPSSPAEGWMYYDTTLHLPRFYNGTIWVNF